MVDILLIICMTCDLIYDAIYTGFIYAESILAVFKKRVRTADASPGPYKFS
jgi:hypothetical protein